MTQILSQLAKCLIVYRKLKGTLLRSALRCIQVSIIISVNCWSTVYAAPESNLNSLRDWVKQRSFNSSISVLDISSGREIFGFNPNQDLKPASVLKIVTSVVALKALGPEFKFVTDVFADGVKESSIKTLYLKGQGDPSLTIESLWLLLRRIRAIGFKRVGGVVLDDSSFLSPKPRSGVRAYQTASHALSFSFNSLGFMVCPGLPGSAASVTADPWETSVEVSNRVKTVRGSSADLSVDETAMSSESFNYIVRGSIGLNSDCELVYRSVADPLKYLEKTIERLAPAVGLIIENPEAVRIGNSDPLADRLFKHESKPLAQIVFELNHFSNNFTAEQLLYAVGDKGEEFPRGRFDRELGIMRLEEHLRALGVSSKEFSIYDGSGLSHENRLSSNALATVLLKVKEDKIIESVLEASLPIADRSGTLKHRHFGLAQGQVLLAKTGSLDGVTSLAGYLYLKSGKGFAVTVIQNGVDSRESGHQFEEQFVRRLVSILE